MAKITEKHFSGWDDFKVNFSKVLFGKEPFRKGKYIFRGHADSSWKLTPSFDRQFRDLAMAGERLNIGIELYNEFLVELKRLDTSKDVVDDERIVLPLAQHYGMPTKLLDWTDSPYVAAFFAFSASSLREDNKFVAIYALDTASPIWNTAYGVQIITPQPFGNIRLRNQYGKFTLSRVPYDDLEEYVSQFPADEGAPLYKFFLPAVGAESVLTDLDAMGINHSALFSDLEGAVRAALFRTLLKRGLRVG